MHTSAALAEIRSLTLDGAVTWTGADGPADRLVAEVRVIGPGGVHDWETWAGQLTTADPSRYVDASGNIVIRFSDSASVRKERKDTLTVDYLVGTIVKGSGGTAPTAPTITSASPTASSVALNWSQSGEAAGYQVWRSGTLAATLTADRQSFNDDPLTPDTTYTYVVRAFNTYGYADSGSVTVHTLASPNYLVAPINVTATVSKGAIKLSWTDNNSYETGYQVLRGTTSDGNFTPCADLAADLTSYSDTDLTRGTTYWYRVRAVNSSQTGPESATVSAKAR